MFFLGYGAYLSRIGSSLLTLFFGYFRECKCLTIFPIDCCSREIFEDWFIFRQEVGHLVSFGEGGVCEEGVGGEVEG